MRARRRRSRPAPCAATPRLRAPRSAANAASRRGDSIPAPRRRAHRPSSHTGRARRNRRRAALRAGSRSSAAVRRSRDGRRSRSRSTRRAARRRSAGARNRGCRCPRSSTSASSTAGNPPASASTTMRDLERQPQAAHDRPGLQRLSRRFDFLRHDRPRARPASGPASRDGGTSRSATGRAPPRPPARCRHCA